jgi:uncharacterized protein (DUF2062 family)
MMSTTMPATQNSSRLKTFWRERVLGVVVTQLTQGVTPQKIALTIALGFNVGIFPIMGSTTLLCAVVGFCLRLNQPVIQLVNWLVYPLQLSTILIFVRIGEHIVGAPPVPFSIPELLRKFKDSPGQFMKDFGMTGVHGIIAWFLIAPFVAALIYFMLLPPLKKLAQVIKQKYAH